MRAASEATPHPLATWLALLAALWVLNFALSFHNVWPTPWVTTRHEVSVEIVLLVLALAAWAHWRGVPSRRVLRGCAIVLLLLCVGRYAEVTAPALYGRRINLYWDAQHLPQVAAMLAMSAPGWVTAATIAAIIAVPLLLYAALRVALGALGQALACPAPRRTLLLAGTVLAALFAGTRLGLPGPDWMRFSLPVTATYAQQAALLADAVFGSPARAALEREPPLPNADLARLDGADVLVIFVESYGATAFERREHRAALANAHATLTDAVTASGRNAVSAFVTSPTFGGASWLAHASLLSGLEVADAPTHAALLTGERDTLVQRFAARGYRTLALMPGLKRAWPEGSYYRFDELYDAARLDYRGPAFGWWAIPDQYALAVLEARELAASPRAPLFAVFPTISTHMPFLPAPPYQPDWERLLGAHPFDARALAASLAREPDWSDLSPAWVHAMSYALNTLAGYVARRPAREQVLVVIGDHQPAAGISGAQAGREVPVHIIARRSELLRAFLVAGFEPGLTPTHPALMPLHALARLLLQAFSEALPATAR